MMKSLHTNLYINIWSQKFIDIIAYILIIEGKLLKIWCMIYFDYF